MDTQLTKAKTNNDQNFLKTIRLINIENDACDFEIGKIPVGQHVKSTYFFAQTEVNTNENIAHPAPRRQFVITIKGKLRFAVTSGKTFILEPGIILIAADTEGAGHTWEILDGEEWERIYIPIASDANDYFIKDINS
ncbi:hypothetical protein [Pedobacter mucosus]|uniref:hypothetical protein n=1 Tax=Pedobacter mucosus TaxID=2895286 RepID=UPI001EE41DA3|nr:hypothetical protein [Pedobacter mucosus]UKT64624.1 hypothetical protein LOK61_02320 [Pedobacter mucosus]